jgi:hypothetical protein
VQIAAVVARVLTCVAGKVCFLLLLSSPFVINIPQQTKKVKFSFAYFHVFQPFSTSNEKDEAMDEVAAEVFSKGYNGCFCFCFCFFFFFLFLF